MELNITIMKKHKIWNILILMSITLPMMVACGGDEGQESKNNGIVDNYTIEEIKNMLSGEWNVYGTLDLTNTDDKIGDFNQNYKGIVTITDEGKSSIYLKLIVTEGKAYTISNGKPVFAEESMTAGKCTIMKKNGNYHIETSTTKYKFEIVSIKNTAFKLALEQDIIINNKVEGHVHMTMITTTDPVPSKNEDPFPAHYNPSTPAANSLEGTWSGMMYVSTSFGGHNYYAISTDIEFIGDPLSRTKGTGYWVDHYSGAPRDYVANHIEWKVNKPDIEIYFVEEDTWMTISDYRLSDNYFTGYINDGSKDVEFRLRHIASPNWDSYRYGYDYYYYW